MKLIDLSNGLFYNDLLQTDDTSVVKILEYLKANIGQLNDLIATSYIIEGNEASPELLLDEAAIFGNIYLMNYYQRQQKNYLGASGYDNDWSEISEGDTRIKRTSRNEIAKNYILLSNDIRDYLYKISESYRRWKCVPASLHSEFYSDLATDLTKTLQQP